MPVPSQAMTVALGSIHFKIDLDTGATVSFISRQTVETLQIEVKPNGQLAILADKKSRMRSMGEIDIILTETSTQDVLLRLRALVVNELGVECYGGQTFMLDNGIVGDVSLGTISLHHGRFVIKQNQPNLHSIAYPPPYLSVTERHHADQDGVGAACAVSDPKQLFPVTNPTPQHCPVHLCCPAPVLRSVLCAEVLAAKSRTEADKSRTDVVSRSKTISVKNPKYILPAGEYQINVGEQPENNCVLIMPDPPIIKQNSWDEPSSWTPQICPVSNGSAVYTNSSVASIQHPSNVHFRAIPVEECSIDDATNMAVTSQEKMMDYRGAASAVSPVDLLSSVKINRSFMTPDQIKRVDEMFLANISAFNEDLTDGYLNEDNPYEATFSFKKENRAPPVKVWVPQFNRKCQDLLQSKCDELERQGVLQDPKEHGVDVRNVSPCFIQQKARAKGKQLEKCDLSEIRFITCYNVLNDSIHPISGRSKSYNDILMFLSRFKYLIFADLYNSYFQVRVAKKHWKYLAVMTPFRGIKVMTRCGQGLLNSDVELDQVLGRVLGDDMSAGYCLAARDDLFVGGNTIDEALDNWNAVLSKIAQNNLKITARKVRMFLGDTEVFGHRITDGSVKPSDHIITTLGKTVTEDLRTVKQVNAWKGLYKTLIRHLPRLAHMMAPFDAACGGKPSASQFDWTSPGILEAFNAATNQLEKINETFLPHPNEQLYLMPDTAKVNLCTGWVLYTKRTSEGGEKLLPVQFASAKLPKYMATWCPCELEGAGAVVAIDQVRHWINESASQPLS